MSDPPRHHDPIAELLSPRAELSRWTRLEIALCRARATRGDVPPAALDRIVACAPRAVDIALSHLGSARAESASALTLEMYLDALAEAIGPAARYVHFGVTESELRTVSLAMQLADVATILGERCDRIAIELRTRALAHRHTACLETSESGAECVTTAGGILLDALAEVQRARARVRDVREAVPGVPAPRFSTGELAGALAHGGAHGSHADPRDTSLGIVEDALRELGLRHVPGGEEGQLACGLALVGLAHAIERAQDRLAALAEPGAVVPGVESDAIPHAPAGVAGDIAAALATALQPDPGADSEGRPSQPELAAALEFSVIALGALLARFAGDVSQLEISAVALRDALDARLGAPLRDSVVSALRRRGVERRDAIARVDRCVAASRTRGAHLLDVLRAAPDVTEVLTAAELDACFDLDAPLADADARFVRALEATEER